MNPKMIFYNDSDLVVIETRNRYDEPIYRIFANTSQAVNYAYEHDLHIKLSDVETI